MLPSADYSHIESTRKMLKDREHVKSCFPAFIATCLRGRLWECEVEDPYSDQAIPPVPFYDFVHGCGARGLGSSYEEIERILRDHNDPELIVLWEEASGRKVHPGREHISLASIRRDGGTQSRAQLDDATVAEYAERLAELPPVTVYHDGDAYWLADGFHRVAAHERAGATEVLCDVRQGSRRDAVLHSVGANADHGLRRRVADKQRAVETVLRDEEWVERSDTWIAEICAVGVDMVIARRAALESTLVIRELSYRIGKDGKKRKLPSKPARGDRPKAPQEQKRPEKPGQEGDQPAVSEPSPPRAAEPSESKCERCEWPAVEGSQLCPGCARLPAWDRSPIAEPVPDPRQVDMFEAPAASEPAPARESNDDPPTEKEQRIRLEIESMTPMEQYRFDRWYMEYRNA